MHTSGPNKYPEFERTSYSALLYLKSPLKHSSTKQGQIRPDAQLHLHSVLLFYGVKDRAFGCIGVMSTHKQAMRHSDPNETSPKFFVHCDNLLM
jgi:hypothetical protein